MRLVIVLWVAAIAAIAHADRPDWELISTSENGVQTYLDVNSARVDRTSVRAWIKLVPSARSGWPFRDAVALWLIDCERDTQTTLSTTSYGDDGSVRSTESNPSRPGEPIVPGSYSATVRDLLCPFRHNRIAD
jgi:hypothetical protein